MAEAEVLNVQVREDRGKRNARRMRAAGQIPAVVYGHGQETVSLAVRSGEVAAALRHGAKLVRLAGGVNDSAVIHEVQWDTFGSQVLHLDFARVSTDESIETTVVLECRGDAPGTHSGGVLEQPVHELMIECPVTKIPEKISINVNTLELNDTITAGELELPSGAKLLIDPSTVVVQCAERAEVVEEEEGAEPAEPEVIGRREDEDSEGAGD